MRVFHFTRLRVPMIMLSVIAVTAGIAGTLLRGGLNLSIDLAGGLSQQFQIAPAGLRVAAENPDALALTVTGQSPVLGRAGQLRAVYSGGERRVTITLPFDDYTTLQSLVAPLDGIQGVSAVLIAAAGTDSRRLLPVSFAAARSDGVRLNMRPVELVASLEAVREALEPLGRIDLRQVGGRDSQEYIVKLGAPSDDAEEIATLQNRIDDLLAGRFGADQVLHRQTDYVGPSFSRFLGEQSISLVAITFVLILLYVTIRFKLAYAVGAIVALMHDALFMVGVLGVFQLEVGAATIAAILTVVGYSLNDTIVIFDRMRENLTLMRDSDFETMVDTSISQSLSRTILTSMTTLMAVAAIYIFGTGVIQAFALNLIIGVLVGTYSTLFIATPVVMGWNRIVVARKRLATTGMRPAAPAQAANPAASTAGGPGAAEGIAGPQPATRPSGPVTRNQPARRNRRKRHK